VYIFFFYVCAVFLANEDEYKSSVHHALSVTFLRGSEVHWPDARSIECYTAVWGAHCSCRGYAPGTDWLERTG